jgi:PAS domain S-box-containing protein
MADLTSAVPLSGAILAAAIENFTEYAFLTLDAEGRITSWNVGAERLFGYARDHAVGKHVSMMLTPDDRESGLARQALQVAERQGSVSANRWLMCGDGRVRYVNATVVACRGESGCTGYAALAHVVAAPANENDIRQMREVLAARAEDASQRLSESNAMLRAEIADRTQAEAARLRLLRRLVMAQEEERRRIARDLHDDLGQRLTALRLTLEALEMTSGGRAAAADATAKARQLLASIDEGLDFLAWELRPAALDELGLTKVLENYVHEWSRHAAIRAVFHAGTRGMERFASEVECTVYRIAQEALNNVAKHAGARSVNVLLEQRGDNLVLVIEDDGVGIKPGQSTEKMIGLTGMRERAAAVGGTLEFEPTPGGGTTLLAHIPVSMPSRVEGSAAVAADDDVALSTDPGATFVSTDTSGAMPDAMRARLQELHQAVTARDEFIATVAHELRNPVSPLMFQVRLAIEKSEQAAASGDLMPAAWVQSQLRRIEQRLHRLLETLDRLLDVSRLSTGRIELQPEPVNLAVTVREVISTFEAELAVARCPLEFSERGDATGWWDRMRLEQICRNVLSNAIRFGAGRPVTVSVEADQDFATLEVRDHGVGIARHLHSRIFERFERGVEQRSGGFGIGLWVVKNICAAMGGSISVDSDLGEGARFTVMLPRRNERDTASGREEDT